MNKRASRGLLAGDTWVFNTHTFAGGECGDVAMQDLTPKSPQSLRMTIGQAEAWYRDMVPKIEGMVKDLPVSIRADEALRLRTAMRDAAASSLEAPILVSRFMDRHPIASLELVESTLSKKYTGVPLLEEEAKIYAKLEDSRFPETTDGCFVAGTLVWTDKGQIPIEQIKVGDMVLSQPEARGELAYKRVKETFVFEEKEIWRVVVMNEEAQESMILVTPNHPVWVSDIGWTSVDKLSFGNEIRFQNGTTGCILKIHVMNNTTIPGVGWLFDKDRGTTEYVDLRRDIIDWENDEIRNSEKGFDGVFQWRVYNFEVEDFHTYYVGEYGLWVHNTHCAGHQSATTTPAIYEVNLRDSTRGEVVPADVPRLLRKEVTALHPNARARAGGYVIVDTGARTGAGGEFDNGVWGKLSVEHKRGQARFKLRFKLLIAIQFMANCVINPRATGCFLQIYLSPIATQAPGLALNVVDQAMAVSCTNMGDASGDRSPARSVKPRF